MSIGFSAGRGSVSGLSASERAAYLQTLDPSSRKQAQAELGIKPLGSPVEVVPQTSSVSANT
jgi:hypothetical protein